MLDKNGWTRSELARQLDLSRAWVTTELKDNTQSYDTWHSKYNLLLFWLLREGDPR